MPLASVKVFGWVAAVVDEYEFSLLSRLTIPAGFF
jgi:hypothetical protein